MEQLFVSLLGFSFLGSLIVVLFEFDFQQSFSLSGQTEVSVQILIQLVNQLLPSNFSISMQFARLVTLDGQS
jgi:hypothetical protein